MTAKLKSRKFWLAVSAHATALIVLFVPEYEQPVSEAVAHAAALLLMGAAALGYINGEAKIDAEHVESEARKEIQRMYYEDRSHERENLEH